MKRIDEEEATALATPLKARAARLLAAIDRARVEAPVDDLDEIERAVRARLANESEEEAS